MFCLASKTWKIIITRDKYFSDFRKPRTPWADGERFSAMIKEEEIKMLLLFSFFNQRTNDIIKLSVQIVHRKKIDF